MWRVVVIWEKLHRVRHGKCLWWCEGKLWACRKISELFPIKWYKEAQVNLFTWRLKYWKCPFPWIFLAHKSWFFSLCGVEEERGWRVTELQNVQILGQYRTPELNSYLQSGTQNAFCHFALKCNTSRGHPNLINSLYLVKATAAQYKRVQDWLKPRDMFYICFSSHGWDAHGETQFGQLLGKQICGLVQLYSQCG